MQFYHSVENKEKVQLVLKSGCSRLREAERSLTRGSNYKVSVRVQTGFHKGGRLSNHVPRARGKRPGDEVGVDYIVE